MHKADICSSQQNFTPDRMPFHLEATCSLLLSCFAVKRYYAKGPLVIIKTSSQLHELKYCYLAAFLSKSLETNITFFLYYNITCDFLKLQKKVLYNKLNNIFRDIKRSYNEGGGGGQVADIHMFMFCLINFL